LSSVFFLIILFFELERVMKKNLSRRTQADQKKTFSEVSEKNIDRVKKKGIIKFKIFQMGGKL